MLFKSAFCKNLKSCICKFVLQTRKHLYHPMTSNPTKTLYFHLGADNNNVLCALYPPLSLLSICHTNMTNYVLGLSISLARETVF